MTSTRQLRYHLALGAAAGSAQLTMVPLLRATPSPLQYQTLRAALAAGTLKITEISAQGSVPNVRVINEGALPVLILEGAALVGAKQNRVLNLTVLVPAKAELLVPVSCVEQGRWHASTAEFREGPAMHFASARASKMRHVSESLVRNAGPRANQGEVWADMASYQSEFSANAPSGAMQDIYRTVETSVEELAKPLQPARGQVGAAFLTGKRLLGLDAFDSADTWQAEMPKIVRSYAVDAVRQRANGSGPRGDQALETTRELLDRLATAEWQEYPGVGLGTDLRLTTPALAAGALEYQGELVHVAAFPGLARAGRDVADHAPAMPRYRSLRD